MWYFNETKLLLENLTSSGQEYFIIKKTESIAETFHVLLYCNNCGNKNTLAFFTSEEEAEKQLRIIARNLKAINLEPEQVAILYYVPNYAPTISYLAEQEKYDGDVTYIEGETIIAGDTLMAGETYECGKRIVVDTPQPTEEAIDTTANKNSEYVITSIHYDTCDDIYYPL